MMIYGCSSSEKSTDEKKNEEEYIFDEVPADDIYNFESPDTNQSDLLYVIQIGAFTTKDKAEQFARESRIKTGNNLKVSFSERVNLFVVHIDPPFPTKKEAEDVRNKLWQTNDFRDAWIVTIRNNN